MSRSAQAVQRHGSGRAASGPHLPDVLGRPAIPRWIGEVRAIVGEHRVDLVRHRGGESAQEVASYSPRGLLVQLNEGELGGAIDGDQQVKAPFFGSHFGDVDVEVAKRVALELALVGRVALDLRQLRDAMALKAAVQ